MGLSPAGFSIERYHIRRSHHEIETPTQWTDNTKESKSSKSRAQSTKFIAKSKQRMSDLKGDSFNALFSVKQLLRVVELLHALGQILHWPRDAEVLQRVLVLCKSNDNYKNWKLNQNNTWPSERSIPTQKGGYVWMSSKPKGSSKTRNEARSTAHRADLEFGFRKFAIRWATKRRIRQEFNRQANYMRIEPSKCRCSSTCKLRCQCKFEMRGVSIPWAFFARAQRCPRKTWTSQTLQLSFLSWAFRSWTQEFRADRNFQIRQPSRDLRTGWYEFN